jgi:hypothetical protein
MPKNETGWETIAVIGIVALFVLWQYVIQPAIIWVQQNIFWIGLFLVGVIGLTIIGFYYNSKEQEKREAEKKAELERKETEIKAEIERKEAERKAFHESQKEDEEARLKESKLYKVTESIKRFKPSMAYTLESGYQYELQGWLKQEFPSASLENSIGASRPDIVIDEIAIEIKGPTGNAELGTLSEKVFKYLYHYENLIIVLFEPSFTEQRYREIKEGIEHFIPNVIFIRKDEK